MSRKSNTALLKTRRAQRSKHERDIPPITELLSTYLQLCGCWSNQPVHTCGQAPPRYCTCGASTGEGCVCPSPIGRVA